MTRFERDKRAAIEAAVEFLERIDKATVNMEKAREEKDLVTFVYWFVLIHEYYYMLCEKPVPQRIAGSIYAEMESYTPIDYLKNKRKLRYERLPLVAYPAQGLLSPSSQSSKSSIIPFPEILSPHVTSL